MTVILVNFRVVANNVKVLKINFYFIALGALSLIPEKGGGLPLVAKEFRCGFVVADDDDPSPVAPSKPPSQPQTAFQTSRHLKATPEFGARPGPTSAKPVFGMLGHVGISAHVWRVRRGLHPNRPTANNITTFTTTTTTTTTTSLG